MKLLKEEWKPVPGFGNRYEVSNLGRVRNNTGYIMKTKVKIKSGRVSPHGEYTFIEFNFKGKRYRRPTHRLVAEAFIPKIPGKPLVNHRDANKWNNAVSNLEWVNYKENAQHAVFMGLNRVCAAPPVTKEQIPEIKEKYQKAVQAICDEYSISKSILTRILSGKPYIRHITDVE